MGSSFYKEFSELLVCLNELDRYRSLSEMLEFEVQNHYLLHNSFQRKLKLDRVQQQLVESEARSDALRRELTDSREQLQKTCDSVAALGQNFFDRLERTEAKERQLTEFSRSLEGVSQKMDRLAEKARSLTPRASAQPLDRSALKNAHAASRVELTPPQSPFTPKRSWKKNRSSQNMLPAVPARKKPVRRTPSPIASPSSMSPAPHETSPPSTPTIASSPEASESSSPHVRFSTQRRGKTKRRVARGKPNRRKFDGSLFDVFGRLPKE